MKNQTNQKKGYLSELKLEIQIKAKNGIDFIISAAILWTLISVIWYMDGSSYNKSIFTFMVGGLLLPLAFALSMFMKTQWKINNNPLQPLGLWLNFAQLIYFPFLIFILIQYPDYFIMTYAIITGAHLFPYAWFYDDKAYAVVSILISFGALIAALYFPSIHFWMIPLLTAVMLFTLATKLFFKIRKAHKIVKKIV